MPQTRIAAMWALPSHWSRLQTSIDQFNVALYVVRVSYFPSDHRVSTGTARRKVKKNAQTGMWVVCNVENFEESTNSYSLSCWVWTCGLLHMNGKHVPVYKSISVTFITFQLSLNARTYKGKLITFWHVATRTFCVHVRSRGGVCHVSVYFIVHERLVLKYDENITFSLGSECWVTSV
jgi:hypothetical protein